MDDPILADSITTLPPGATGRVVVCGSHGGRYPALLALGARLRAVLLNDAGGGLDGAGRASLAVCEAAGMAACVVDTMSCRIGDAADMLARGRVSAVNALAARCGAAPGHGVREAAAHLSSAPVPAGPAPPTPDETRRVTTLGARRLVLVDSASLVRPEDADALVVTGSHGGLIGGDPARALKARAHVAVFNDAGGGRDRCGVTRLPALDAKGVAAVCVASASARIGEARSTYEDGIVSVGNALATAMGAESGLRLRAFLDAVAHPA